MNHFYRLVLLLALVPSVASAQLFETVTGPQPPKREFRAAWVATVANLDWPSGAGLPADVQKNQLVSLFNTLQNAGINVVIFQIRPECDALYASTIEPWSYYLSGNQGSPPNPFYDPLEFAVQEAHARGMELHAWFNPYRSVRVIGLFPIHPSHVSITHPEWNITIGSFRFLNPGLPEVRSYVTNVIMDVVRRYDIDGVHFDDYFYPYPTNQITNQDDSAFAVHGGGMTRGDWRRWNVNTLIKTVHDSIKAEKPRMKFGMSPFGIWKNGVPPGITGLDAYSTIYCDAIAWLRDQSIDYLTPQLYWRIGGPQDYSALMPWWSDSAAFYGRHHYPGHIFRTEYSTSELPNQLRLDRANPKVDGGVWFRAQNFVSNTLGFFDSVRTDLYRHPALLPVMPWIDTIPPYFPRNIRYEPIAAGGPAVIRWDAPLVAPDGETASRYVVYRIENPTIMPGDLDSSRNIVDVVGGLSSTPPPPVSGPAYYAVTALDRNYNEGGPSNVLTVFAPAAPVLASPASGSGGQPPEVILRWNYLNTATSYRLQVSTDPAFAGGMLINQTGIADTFRVVTGMSGQTTYHWRVSANNAGGTGEFSDSWNFTTGFPAAPTLVYPGNNTVEIPVNITFVWNTSAVANSYRFQLSRSADFATLVVDSASLTDTSISVFGLDLFTIYFWRASAINAIGQSDWPAANRFRTTNTVSVTAGGDLPREFALKQNYPNPFNPYTTIAFSVPQQTSVSLRVYDVLGREVAVLLDEPLQPGNYQVQFDGGTVASGVYFYRLVADGFVQTRKMQLVK
jgi:uncharacterized lipoprotein YddW (UPF0748 family)